MLQVWQNVLQLFEYEAEQRVLAGRIAKVDMPTKRRIIDRCSAAAIFVKYGFDR